MKIFCLAALLALASQAVKLDQSVLSNEVEPYELSQTETEACLEVDTEADSVSYPEGEYHCKPVLGDCPGVHQIPGVCKTLLDAADGKALCYCNNGWYHTDWDHNISIDKKNPCANCGTATTKEKVII